MKREVKIKQISSSSGLSVYQITATLGETVTLSSNEALLVADFLHRHLGDLMSEVNGLPDGARDTGEQERKGIFFKSVEHRTRFLSIMQQLEKIDAGKLDQEYGAAVYLFTSSFAMWDKAGGYVSRRGIDVEAMLQEVDFSGGESVIVLLAGNLFNGEHHVDPRELMRLDGSNFQVALAALQLRRSSVHVTDIK